MTSSEQDKIIEALSVEHGAVKVLPLRGTTAVLACGWIEDEAVGASGGLAVAQAEQHDPRNDGSLAMWVRALAYMTLAAKEEDSRGKWWYVPADPATAATYAHEDDVPLRYAYEQEVADAHEQDAVRELLSAAGLRP